MQPHTSAVSWSKEQSEYAPKAAYAGIKLGDKRMRIACRQTINTARLGKNERAAESYDNEMNHENGSDEDSETGNIRITGR